jgi:hypothetical protein
MELHYWKKQLILYTKNHFGRIDYEKDLKRFAAELYYLSPEHVEKYSVLHMVVDLYQRLVDEGHISFKLEGFISDIFRRSFRERNSREVIYDDVLRQMLAEIQGIVVLGANLNLGSPDEKMLLAIQEDMQHVEEKSNQLKEENQCTL